MSKKTKLIQILPRESIINSIIKDTYSLAILSFFFWFNDKFIGGSYLVNFLVLIGCFVYVLKDSKFGKKTSYRISNQKLQQIQSILEDEKNN